jgi:hypothetical protein
MTFEENPIILIVLVIATIEGWNLAKVVTRSILERRKRPAAERR